MYRDLYGGLLMWHALIVITMITIRKNEIICVCFRLQPNSTLCRSLLITLILDPAGMNSGI